MLSSDASWMRQNGTRGAEICRFDQMAVQMAVQGTFLGPTLPNNQCHNDSKTKYGN